MRKNYYKYAIALWGNPAYYLRTMIELDEATLRSVLGEVFADQLKVIHEYLQDIPIMKQDLRTLKEDMVQVKSELAMMRVWHREHQSRLDNHEDRIAALEAGPV